MTINQSLVVTDAVNAYRESTRLIWNGYFRKNFNNTKDWSLVDSFKLVKEELFRSIVLTPVLDEIPNDFVLGRPSTLIQVRLVGDWPTSVMLNRNKGETHGYWDHPIKELEPSVVLMFVDFFDWVQYDFMDMALVVAEVSAYKDNPSIVGHRLIVEVRNVEIVVSSVLSV